MEYNVLHCSLSTARPMNMWNIPLILYLFHVLLKTKENFAYHIVYVCVQ
jgi:hypothetical protein